MPTETDLPSRLAISRGSRPNTGWIALERGAFRWDINTSFGQEWLNEHGELPISAWLAEGLAAIVKTGPHRTVYRLALSSGIYYLKHYRTPDWRAVLQNLVRPSKADLEWRAAERVAGLGLRTFETAAIGRRHQLGVVRDNYLITREIKDARSLDEFILKALPSLPPEERRTAGRQIAKQLAEMTARLHRGGLLHRDLHPGNVLVQHPTGQLQLYLIDLHALRRKRKLSRAQVALNLSLLNNFFARLTSRSDRLRFLKAYAEVWNRENFASAAFDREAVRFVERICRRELDKADRRGDKKWQRGNRRLIILESPPNRCRGLAGLGREQLASFQAQPEKLLREPHLIAWRNRDQFHQRAMIEVSFNAKPVRAIATAFSKPNLARNAWEMGHALLRRRLPAPRPLLFVETKTGEWDYLVVEQIPDAGPLESELAKPHQERWLNKLLIELAFQLRTLHEHGFHQPKLSVNSILLANSEPIRLWFAELEQFQKFFRVDSLLVIESLANCLRSLPAGVGLRHTHCLRFLLSYLGSRFSAEWKTYWRDIASTLVSNANREAA